MRPGSSPAMPLRPSGLTWMSNSGSWQWGDQVRGGTGAEASSVGYAAWLGTGSPSRKVAVRDRIETLRNCHPKRGHLLRLLNLLPLTCWKLYSTALMPGASDVSWMPRFRRPAIMSCVISRRREKALSSPMARTRGLSCRRDKGQHKAQQQVQQGAAQGNKTPPQLSTHQRQAMQGMPDGDPAHCAQPWTHHCLEARGVEAHIDLQLQVLARRVVLGMRKLEGGRCQSEGHLLHRYMLQVLPGPAVAANLAQHLRGRREGEERARLVSGAHLAPADGVSVT